LLYDNSSPRPPEEHNAEEEHIRREHIDYINRMEMLCTINLRSRPMVNVNANIESLSSSFIPEENLNDISDDSMNDPLLEEVNLFLAADHSIPPGIEDFYDPEGDIRFLEALLINDSTPFSVNKSFNFEDDPSFPRPPPEPSDNEFDLEPEAISEVMENIDEPIESFDPGGEIFVSTNDEDVVYLPFMFVIRIFMPYLIHLVISPLFISAESEDTVFDPGISD
nr:hypothetical protein [Tanacetum cinerariifolium]